MDTETMDDFVSNFKPITLDDLNEDWAAQCQKDNLMRVQDIFFQEEYDNILARYECAY